MHMLCGGSCSSCGEVDPGRATRMAKRAFDGFKPRLEDHDTSDSAYNQKRPLSVSLGPRSAAPGPRFSSVTRDPPATFKGTVGRTSSHPPLASAAPVTPTGPCGTAKTTNKVPGVVK